MDTQSAVDMGQQAIMTSLLVSSPILIIGLIVGLGLGLLQALTQIQDQTVAFVPKIVAMVLVLSLCLPWLVQHMLDYSATLITNIPRMISGG